MGGAGNFSVGISETSRGGFSGFTRHNTLSVG